MNKAKGKRQKAKVGVFLAILLAVVCGFSPSAARGADDVQEVVFLTEARPVLVRLHVRVDGKPLQTAYDDFMKHLFGHLDINGDGVLSKEEAARTPTMQQILTGGLGQAFGGGGGFGGGGAPAAPTLETLDTDKDGKVTPAELTAHYRKSGLLPFQVQVSAPQANPLGAAAAFLGGPRGEPPVEKVAEAIFAQLDADKDGKLTKTELAKAPAVLLKLDDDEDEIVTTQELVPNYTPPGGPLAGLSMMGSSGSQGAGKGNKTLMAVTTPGEAPAGLVLAMQERYGPKADKAEEKKLNRKDLGLDEPTFGKMDANRDGLLDAAELAGFVKRTPDLDVVLRLGDKAASEARVEIVAVKGKASPLAAKVQVKGALANLDLGATRVDLRTSEEKSSNSFGEIIKQQVLVQLRQADTDSNGVVDEKEAEKNRLFKSLFKMMDRDGDGKVTEKELDAYLDQARELQTRATAGCVSLLLTDQSRGLFDLLDTDRDSRLSVQEMRQAGNHLTRFDLDSKGSLAKSDLPKSYTLALQRGPGNSGAAANPLAAFEQLYGSEQGTAEDIQTVGPLWFRKMDRNRDGYVSPKEFLFGEEAFRKLDTDGDGLLSPQEAAKADAQERKKAG